MSLHDAPAINAVVELEVTREWRLRVALLVFGPPIVHAKYQLAIDALLCRGARERPNICEAMPMPTPVSLPQYASSYLENRSFAQGRTVYAYERLGGGQQSAIDSALRGSPLIAAKRNARWRQRSQVSSF